MAVSWARSAWTCCRLAVGLGGGDPGLAGGRCGAPTGTFGTPLLGGLGVVVVVVRRAWSWWWSWAAPWWWPGVAAVVVVGALVVVVVVGLGTVVVGRGRSAPWSSWRGRGGRQGGRAGAGTVVSWWCCPRGCWPPRRERLAMRRATVTPAALTRGRRSPRVSETSNFNLLPCAGRHACPAGQRLAALAQEATCGEERPPRDGRMSSGAAAGRVRPVRGLSCAAGQRPERPGPATGWR